MLELNLLLAQHNKHRHRMASGEEQQQFIVVVATCCSVHCCLVCTVHLHMMHTIVLTQHARYCSIEPNLTNHCAEENLLDAGPEQAITHCIQPGHLQQIASILQPAVSSCLQTQMQALVQMPAVSVQQHHQGFTTAKAQPSRTAAMGSKTCALFGCLGQLWELQSKTSSGSSTQAASSAGMTVDMGQSKTAGPGQNNDLLAHGKNSKREQGDSESEEDAMSDGSSTDGSSSEVVVVDQEEGMKAAHQQMPGDEMHEAFSAQQDGEGDAAVLHAGKGADLNRLVWDLKVMLGKPWSFQAESGETSGRWAQEHLVSL